MIYYMSAKCEVEFNKVKANGVEERSADLRKLDTTTAIDIWACECFIDKNELG